MKIIKNLNKYISFSLLKIKHFSKYINWHKCLLYLFFPFIISLFLFPRNSIIQIPFGNSFFLSSVGTSTYSFSRPSGQLQNILYKVLKLDLPIGSYQICLYNGSTGTKNRLPIKEEELRALEEYTISLDVYPFQDNFDQNQKDYFLRQLNPFESTDIQKVERRSQNQLIGLTSINAKAGETECISMPFDQNGFVFSLPSYAVVGGSVYAYNYGPAYSEYDGVRANLSFNGGGNQYTVNIASTTVFMSTEKTTIWIYRFLLLIAWCTLILLVSEIKNQILRMKVNK